MKNEHNNLLTSIHFLFVCIWQGQGQYTKSIKAVEEDIQTIIKQVNELTGIKESDTGLAPPALWDLAADKQTLQHEQPLQVARCTKIINADSDDPKYIINVKQFAKFVVDLADSVAPTDIEEGMRVGVDRNKYQIHIPLPPKIDPTVTMMQVEEKPDVTYSDVGGCKEQIEKLREVVETPLLHVRYLTHIFMVFFLHVTCSLIIHFFVAREICKSGYRTTKGCTFVWPTRNWKDTLCKSSSQQNRCLLYSCHWF